MANETLPLSHRENNEKLIADGYVYLFEVKLLNGQYLYLKNNNTVKWNGHTWTGIPLDFSGYSVASGESLSRPTLSVANPEGQFSTFIRDGLILKATITRYSVLYDDVLNDRPIYQKKVWVAWNVPQLTNQAIQLELRNPMDGVNFDLPARTYMPPEFPSVRLK